MRNSSIFVYGKFGFYVCRLAGVALSRADLHRAADRGSPLVVA